jgi:hypothetical protein
MTTMLGKNQQLEPLDDTSLPRWEPPKYSLSHAAWRLRSLVDMMHDVSVVMEYSAGFDPEMQRHARELMSASHIASGWADAIEEKIADKEGEA